MRRAVRPEPRGNTAKGGTSMVCWDEAWTVCWDEAWASQCSAANANAGLEWATSPAISLPSLPGVSS